MSPKRSGAGLRKGREQSNRQRVLKGLVFRVPLYTDHEPCARKAYRFDLTIRGNGFDAKLWGRTVNPLGMKRIHHDLGRSGEPRQQPARE